MSLNSANRSLQLVMRLLDANTATEPVIDWGPQKPEISTGHSSQPLPSAVPERLGVPSRHIAHFLLALDREPTLRMHDILIVRKGQLLCKAAFGAQDPDLPRQTYSACKSITALAIGLLMDDGLLHPDDKLTDLFPSDCGPVSRRLMKDLTLEHVLTMQTGNLFNETSSMAEADWTKGFFQSPSLTDPIGKFQYNSLNTYILAVLVTRMTGQSLSAFLRQRLFDPMGIGDYIWEKSPEAIEKGGWGLYMRPEDLAKLAQLVMDDGCWNGHQLISPHFLHQATTCHIVTPESCGDYNYGWQIWVGRQDNTFLFNGMLGQNVLGFRDSGIIVVSHAGNNESFQQSAYFDLVSRYFGGSFPQSLPKDTLGERELRKVLLQLADCSGSVPTKEQFQTFAGKRLIPEDPRAASCGLMPLLLQAVENCYTRGLQAIAIGGTRVVPELLYEERDALHQICCGTKAPIVQALHFRGNVFRVAVQAKFTQDEDDHPVLKIRLDFLETPCTRILKLICMPEGFLLKQEETPGVDFITQLAGQVSLGTAAKAILSTLLGSSEADYLQWRMRLLFAPKLRFTEDQ